MVKTRTCLWYFCGQTRNRRGFYHGDFHFGGPNRDRTLRMRTVRSRNVVSFLPTDCGVWFDENDGRGADARNTTPQFFNKEGVDSKLICGED